MKSSQTSVQCQGYCEYHWDGNQWTFVTKTCSQGCGCVGPPPQPPPHTPPFTQFVPCTPVQRARKLTGKYKRTCVRIQVAPELDVCLTHVSMSQRQKRK
jgi:hypothetical protein